MSSTAAQSQGGSNTIGSPITRATSLAVIVMQPIARSCTKAGAAADVASIRRMPSAIAPPPTTIVGTRPLSRRKSINVETRPTHAG